MIWFFAALIVLALGAVGAVAAGRGAPMARVYDDRPDALVPAEGPLGGEDVRSVRFSLAFRGYRMSEVDALLARLSEQLDAPRVGASLQAEDAESAHLDASETAEPAPPEDPGALNDPGTEEAASRGRLRRRLRGLRWRR